MVLDLRRLKKKKMGISFNFLVVFSVLLAWSFGHHYFEPGAIHFPLLGVSDSIHEESFSASEQRLPIGRCEQVVSGRRVVLNLPDLGHPTPPNPYPGFIESSWVNCVNLASNGIYQVATGSFDKVPNLNYLDLSYNRLQLCYFFLFGTPHPKLVTLVIEENTPPLDSTIDKSISKAECFSKLRYLYLRNNSLRSLTFSLKQAFPMLTHLFLSDNNVDSKSFIRDLPNSLSHIYLERNLISNLDCFVMKDLQELHLDGNIIQSICYRDCFDTSLKLEGVHKLTTLTVSQNRIMDIEACAFHETKNLTVLDLAANDLDELKRETFEQLTMLKELNLDDNHLRCVPNLCNNQQLTSLSIKRNKLITIRRDNFKNMRALKYLFLGGNQIKSIETGSFEDLENLTDLDLSDNGLDFIPSDWLRWQWNLRTLDVRGNKFKCLEQLSLGAAPFLHTIYMQNNPVTHISGTVVSKLAPNVILHLHLNDSSDKISSDCYVRCNEDQIRKVNETYNRWIDNH